MSNDTLTQLRNLLKYAQDVLKKCESAYKGLLAFRDNEAGIAFSTKQLYQAAMALRDDAERLVAIAEDLQNTYRDLTQPEEVSEIDISIDGISSRA